MRELVVSVGNAEQRDALVGFLAECGAHPRVLDERSVALDLDDGGCGDQGPPHGGVGAHAAAVLLAVLAYGPFRKLWSAGVRRVFLATDLIVGVLACGW
jgi:hypothetical protein